MARLNAWHAWLALSPQAAQLGWEAQSVMALRIMRLATPGRRRKAEARLMATEKVAALVEAQTAAAAAMLKGGSPPHAAKKMLGVYKKRVRRNRRRLTR
jgi:hypothetical protein